MQALWRTAPPGCFPPGVSVLREQHALVLALKADAGDTWQENDLVFPSRSGTVADAANVRRSFRKVTALAGPDPTAWTPRELRHSFVSLMSDAGVPIERISQLVGHSGTTVTEAVYPQADPAGDHRRR